MFKSIKITMGIVIAISMCALAIAVFVINKVEHNALMKQVVESNTSAISNSLASQLSVLADTGSDNVDRYELIFKSVREHNYLISATLYDINYKAITSVALRKESDYGSAIPSSPRDIPYGVTLHSNDVITTHNLVGTSTYPLGHVVIHADAKAAIPEQSARTLVRQFFLILVIGLLCVGICLLVTHRLITPLFQLKRFTQDLFETKDYALRSSISSQNEFGQLGSNINSLLDTIEVELLINFEQKQTLFDQQETMARLANYDSLTGLPNRQYVLDNLRLELARAKRNDEDMMLLFFDLDGFKGINDSLGHETGDLILIEVADRVQRLLRNDDLFARLGGDEFIVLPDREVNDYAAEQLAIRLLSAFDEPFEMQGLSLTVGISVGVAKASDANFELSDLMSNADLAMYRSKARGRGSYTLFTPDMVESHKRKLQIANGIEQGLREDEFIVYYQVKVDNYGHVIGAEALIRWQHPEFGLVMPNEFIPIAEQGGKITAITQWIIKRVCIDLPDIKHWAPQNFKVSVNLSGHDLRNAQLFDYIYNTLNVYDVNPENMEFEVTESAYLENFQLSNKFFRRMSNMGCSIALDDFGTGYSSLSYLTQITIDTLKVDRQFVMELQTSERSRLVTGAIIDLAKRLSLTVCAEGIETYEQWDYLRQHGCDNVQGFMFSKPVPLKTLLSLAPFYDEKQFKS